MISEDSQSPIAPISEGQPLLYSMSLRILLLSSSQNVSNYELQQQKIIFSQAQVKHAVSDPVIGKDSVWSTIDVYCSECSLGVLIAVLWWPHF